MKTTALLIGALVGLSACGSDTPTSSEKAEAPEKSASSIQTVNVDDLSYRVLVTKGGETALVGKPQQRGSFQGRDVEAAAQMATGCAASIVPGEWAFLGDLKSFELSNLRPNVRRPFPAWEVTLRC